MKNQLRLILALSVSATVAATVTACGGGGHGSIPDSTPAVIAPGSTYTMQPNNSILVPAGATVTANGSVTTVAGDHTTTNTANGAVVFVPLTATGSADNTVTDQ
ncbi:putative small lipoprotein YifL [Oxalobacteraceae bacterium GrIS 2.11]